MYPANTMGELLVQELTGLPVIWRPLGDKGKTVFDNHIRGEGYSLADWLADSQSGKFTANDLEAMRAGCFVRVRCKGSKANEFWKHTEEDVDITKRFDPLAISSIRSASGKARDNHMPESFVSAVGVELPVLPGDVARLRAELDTLRNAVLTSGTGKTYATITAAITASSSGDMIRIFATAGNQYAEDIADGGKQLEITADDSAWLTQTIVGQGAAQVVNITGQSTIIRGLIIDGTAATANGVLLSGSGSAAIACIVKNVTNGLARGIALASGYTRAINCIAYSCGTGLMGASSVCDGFYHSHARGCTTGINGALANWGAAILCTAVDNTTDFGSNLIAARSRLNASGDSTAPGSGSATSLLSGDYDANYRLKTSVAGTTKARFYGMSALCCLDIDGDMRKYGDDANIVFAGPSDPDPLFSPTGYALPAVGNVLSGSGTYGLVTGTELTPTGANIDFPDVGNVTEDDTVNGNAGTYHEATEAQVQLGVTFGANQELTGTYGGSAPTAPDIAVARASDTSATVTFSESQGGVTNEVRYATIADGGDTWLDGGSRSGDGAVTLSGLTSGQMYLIIGYSVDGTNYSEPSNVVIYTSGPASGAVGAYATFLNDLYNEVRNSAALAAVVSTGTPSNHCKLGWHLWTGTGENTLIANGPLVYIEPQAHTLSPRTSDRDRAAFSAELHVYYLVDQSSANNLMTAINFNDALVKEIMAEGNNTGTHWSTYGVGISASIEGPSKVDGQLNRLYSRIVISAGWSEVY